MAGAMRTCLPPYYDKHEISIYVALLMTHYTRMHNESGSPASGVPKGPTVVGLRYVAGGPSQSWLRRGHAANCEWVGQDQQDMQLISVNTGLPQEVTWHGRVVITAIYKQPVDGRVAVRKLNLDGDRQADLSVHGGEHKAIYSTRSHTTTTGSDSCPGAICPWPSLGKTSPPTACWKPQSILATGSLSIPRR